MIIRTISQLPKTEDELTTGSLFEVSVKKAVDDGYKYISKAITIDSLKQQIYDYSMNQIEARFSLTSDTDGDLNIYSIYSKLNDIQDNDSNINGVKTFTGIAKYSAEALENQLATDYDETNNGDLATVAYIQKSFEESPLYVSQNKDISNGALITTGSQTGSDILKAYFDGSNTDASNTSTIFIANHTGHLIMYGWLADTGSVDTAASWVTLEAFIEQDGISTTDGSTVGKWVILQLQPWIIGSKHSNLQYVGFNVPIYNGTKLRIRTGFEVNYDNSSYATRSNTLVSNVESTDGINITNAFIGYILH